MTRSICTPTIGHDMSYEDDEAFADAMAEMYMDEADRAEREEDLRDRYEEACNEALMNGEDA